MQDKKDINPVELGEVKEDINPVNLGEVKADFKHDMRNILYRGAEKLLVFIDRQYSTSIKYQIRGIITEPPVST